MDKAKFDAKFIKKLSMSLSGKKGVAYKKSVYSNILIIHETILAG